MKKTIGKNKVDTNKAAQNKTDLMKVCFTVTGLVQRLPSTEFIKPDMEVTLEKEPDNEWDKEAIRVLLPGLGHIGYVANSVRTVMGDSYSAGRLYDKIGETAKAKVLYNLNTAVICEIEIA